MQQRLVLKSEFAAGAWKRERNIPHRKFNEKTKSFVNASHVKLNATAKTAGSTQAKGLYMLLLFAFLIKQFVNTIALLITFLLLFLLL